MIVARRMIADRRRSLAWWSVGVSALVASNVALYPSIRDVPAFADAFEQLPEGFKTLFGGSAALELTSPAGYLNGRQYSLVLPVLLILFAVGLAASAIAGAEEEGTLESVLALPVTRRRVAIERFGALILGTVGLSLLSAVVLVAMAPAVGLLKGLSASSIFVATGVVCALALFHAAIAFAVGCLWGRRSLAQGVNAAIIVGGYTLHGIAAVSESLRGLRWASPWYWFVGQNALVEGADPIPVLLPLLAALVLVALGVRRFESRDLR